VTVKTVIDLDPIQKLSKRPSIRLKTLDESCLCLCCVHRYILDFRHGQFIGGTYASVSLCPAGNECFRLEPILQVIPIRAPSLLV
jgi:hypothetical protein